MFDPSSFVNPTPLAHADASSSPVRRTGIPVSKIIIRICSTVRCYFRLYSPKNWEFRTICQLSTRDDRHPCTVLGLPPYTIITYSVKKWQLVEPVCAIVEPVFVWGPRASRSLETSLRERFVEWAQNEIAVVPNFHKRILFSDEAHFWLNGYVNKENCRIWSEANPQVYVETPLHPEKLTVSCALWAGGILLQKR
ncbi:hypothetical protein TNCV_2766641 [Trichonephila clavipes]|nr:hypothetical protein TNCV_2766641 [Trichonephila clavipes]